MTTQIRVSDYRKIEEDYVASMATIDQLQAEVAELRSGTSQMTQVVLPKNMLDKHGVLKVRISNAFEFGAGFWLAAVLISFLLAVLPLVMLFGLGAFSAFLGSSGY